tara:strand:- start:1068 stop:1292 length:225 start_codon:yes stop_codon:yes gene_type:complete
LAKAEEGTDNTRTRTGQETGQDKCFSITFIKKIMTRQVIGQDMLTLKTLQNFHGQVTGQDKHVSQTFIKNIINP